MKKNKKQNYVPPSMDVIELELEHGIATASTLPNTNDGAGVREEWEEADDVFKDFGGENSEWWDD